MVLPQRWRCWNCATTLKTRRPARIQTHLNVCQKRTARQFSQAEAGDHIVAKRVRRGGSVDLSDKSKATPAIIDWNICPVNGCNTSVPSRHNRLVHMQRHIRQRKPGAFRRPTPAEHMVKCLHSVAGPSTKSGDVASVSSPDVNAEAYGGDSYEEDVSPASSYYTLSRPISRIENRKLASVEERVSFKMTEHGIQLARNGHLLALMDIIIRDIISKHKSHIHARLRIVFDSDSLDYAFSGTFQRADEFDVFNFLEHLERILNSKQSVGTDDNIQLYVQSIADPVSGSGRHTFRRKDYASTHEFFRQRKSIFYIKNNDNSCFFLAVAAGLRFMRLNENATKNLRGTAKKFKRISPRWKRTPHTDAGLAKEASLFRGAIGHPSDQPVTAKEFTDMQRQLNNIYGVQLIVFNSEDSNAVCFAGEPPRAEKKQLHLAFGSNHYCFIKRLKCSLKCDRCETRACFQFRKNENLLAEMTAPTKCNDCGHFFYSESCRAEHQKRKICHNYTTCLKCNRIYRNVDANGNVRVHECNAFVCSNCKDTVSSPHLCSTQLPKIVNKKQFIIIIFDIETYVDAKGVHKAYLICMDRVCELCCDIDYEDGNECDQCGPRTNVFYGIECVADFCGYLIRGCNEGAVLLSHNGSGFDNYFVIDQIIGDHGKLDVTTRGHRFLSVNIGRNIKMLDTYMFFFCRLAALSSIFEIPEQKGYFPYKIATLDHLDMLSHTHPAPDYYGFDQMGIGEREMFMQWYDQVKDKPFDFRASAIEYCCMDVTLLRKSSMRFRRLLIDAYGVDPWQNALTLSHLASLIYRKCFMPRDESLGIMPSCGYTDLYKKQTSLLCVKYLEWVKQENGTNIIHGGTELEPRFLGKYPCDGVELVDWSKPVTIDNTKRIWDIRGNKKLKEMNLNNSSCFIGCFYHVHRDNCRINRRLPNGEIVYMPHDINKFHPLKKNMTYRDIIDADNLRVESFKSRGIDVSIVYECEIDEMVKENKRFSDFFNNKSIWEQYVLPIGPRSALFGGRVTVARLLCELTDEEMINGYEMLYDDIISLYPSVMRSHPYPTGHPDIIKFPKLPERIDERNIDDFFGIMKIKVLPPQNLLFGVLPYRMNNKLLFPLCIKCAEEYTLREIRENEFDEIGNIKCSHADKDRSFWGVFCNVEVKLAIQMGYQILQISEIWKYQKGDLFSSYVNGMIAMKVENSGYPDGCSTDTQKQDYVDAMAADNIVIDPDNIRKCNGKRQIGKLFANSLWGKISQGIDITNTEFIRQPRDLSRLMRDPAVDITDVVFLDRGQCLCISSKRRQETKRNMQLYSPTVGSFVTAYGRIRLYELMHGAGRNFIYGDTDSIIYLTGPGLFKANYGAKVGDVVSEIDWPNDSITNFVAIGPKTYSYKTRLGKSCVKAKGLCLRGETGETVNFEHLKTIVLGQTNEIGPLFYDALNEPLRSRLMKMHHDKLKSTCKPFLLLPQNRIKKDKTSIELENFEMIKTLQSTGNDKRRTLRHSSLRTVEFGYKTQTDFF